MTMDFIITLSSQLPTLLLHKTGNCISDLDNNRSTMLTNTAKKQRLLRAKKALQTLLISQISQLANGGQVQLEAMGKYPRKKSKK